MHCCTTDEYQGKENDIVLVSLVVSKTVTKHLRDERRINVLTSRAKNVLILFGKESIFSQCVEWAPVLEVVRRSNPCMGLQVSVEVTNLYVV